MAGAIYGLTRRGFLQSAGVAGLGLLAACGPLPGQAQTPISPATPARRVGILFPEATDAAGNREQLDAFREALAGLGHVQGQNLEIDARHAEGDPERLRALAADLASTPPVDVIVARGPLAAPAAKQVTASIPIVFIFVGDPVGTGLVASLSRPGGNVTGLSNLNEGLSAKRLQLLAEGVRGLSRVAVLWNPRVASNAADIQETRAAAETLNLRLISLEMQQPDDFDRVLDAAVREQAEAVVWLGDVVTAARFPEFVYRTRLPAMARFRNSAVDDAALMVYAASPIAMVRRAAYYVDRILKGAKPADLPVEQPREFDFVINLKMAQALGLTIPQHVLLQATEIIQ
jgi:putative ABC transport system substrate-binding protein